MPPPPVPRPNRQASPATSNRQRALRRPPVEHVAALSIPLKPTDKPVAQFPPSFYATLLKEYATKYLEQIHALPTPENIAMVAQHLPLQSCRVTAAWKSRGCLSDVLTIDARSSTTGENDMNPEEDNEDASSLPPLPTPSQTPLDTPIVFGTDFEKTYCVEHVQWSFNDMKHRYVYPFNVIHKVPIVIDSNGYPSAKSIHFSVAPERRVYKPSPVALAELFQPPSTLTFDIITNLQVTFFDVIPFDMVEMQDPKDQKLLRQHLTCPATLHLIGFLSHYLYWTILRPLATRCAELIQQSDNNLQQQQLTPADLEQLLVSLTNSFNEVKQSIQVNLPPTTTKPTPPILPLFVLSLRVTIDTIFRTTYPKWLDDNSTRIEPTLLAISNRMDELLDPHGYFDRIGPLEATVDAINFTRTHAFKMQKRKGPRLRDTFYATSHAMKSILPAPSSGGPRRLLVECGGNPFHRENMRKGSKTLLSLGNRIKLMKSMEDGMHHGEN